MTSEWRTEYSHGKEEWEKRLGEAENAERFAKGNYVKASAKTALSNGTVAAELYDRLIKAGDAKNNIDMYCKSQPAYILREKDKECIALYEATQEEWDTAHKEKTKWLERWDTARFENGQLKVKYTDWKKEMQEKGEYLRKKEEMRQQAKKID
jgi:hypothetical protein